jgi:hypothetical protein
MLLLAAPAMMALTAVDVDAQDASPPMEGLALWLRADAGVQTEGLRVVRWEDQSGRGNDASAEEAGEPVLVEGAIGGRPAVRFDGAHSHLVIPHAPELNATSGFAVLCVYQWSDGFRIAQKKSNHGGLAPDAWFLTPTGGLGLSGRFLSRTWFARDRWYVQTSVFDAQQRTVRVYRYGEEAGILPDVPPPQPNEDPVYLGQRLNPGGTEGYLRGDLAELLIYNVALRDDVRAQAEAYLSAKYDLKPPEKPIVYVTRVIPAHQQVTVEWNPPEGDLAQAVAQYRLDIKLRQASWDTAHSVGLPRDARSATATGLLNQADYALRVVALGGQGNELGMSAERLATPGWVPGTVIDYLHREDSAFADWGQYIGSPSIARLPDGALVASHDLFGPGTSDFSRIFRSDDNGETWRHLADVRPAFWGKLFVHRGALYLLACQLEYGGLLLHRSVDGGATWDGPAVIAPGRYHKAPVPVIEHKGKLWTCVELQTGGWPAGFQSVACSIPLDADPMEPGNWTVGEPLPCSTEWLPEGWEVAPQNQGFLEGNAVVAPNGRLLNILRYNTVPYANKAIILDIAEDGRSLTFDRVIDFPGGMTKFTTLRHPETGVYWSLVNPVTIPDKAGMRSVLSLSSSTDLLNWTLHGDILRDDSPWAVQYTGFQYVDWLFDGPDIIAACRMGFNGSHNFHDANYLTFHRIKDFEKGVSPAKEATR